MESKVENNLLPLTEKTLISLFENTGTAMMIIDEKATIVLANKEFELLSGCPKEDIEGQKSWTNFVALEEDLKQVDEYHYLLRTRHRKAPDKFEFCFQDINGHLKQVLASGGMIPDTKKSIISLMDVSESKPNQEASVERKLNESDKLYQTLVEYQVESVCRWLPDTTLTFVNEGYCKFFGYDRQELVGQKFLPLLPEEDQASFLKFRDSLVKNPRVDVIEHKVIAHDGSIHWQEWINCPIMDDQGNISEFQAVGRDITKRKQIEEQLWIRTYALESSINGMFLTDLDGHISYVNSSFLDIVKCDQKNDLLGQYFAEYLETKAMGEQILDILYKQGSWQGELKIRRIDGKLIEIDLSTNLVHNHSGTPVCVMASCIDISSKKESERALQLAYEKLEKRVNKRTQELRETNTRLQKEVIERKQYEKVLQEKTEEQELLLDNIPIQIWFVSNPENYRFANQARAEFLGLDKSRLKNVSAYKVMNQEDAELCILENKKVYDEKKPLYREGWYTNIKGEKRLLATTRIPKMDKQGNVQFVIVVARDITEQRQIQEANERNRDQLNRSQKIARVATWERDFQTGEIFWSDEQYRRFGYSPEEVIDKKEIIKKHIFPEDLDQIKNHLRAALRGEKTFEVTFRYTTKDGQERMSHCLGEVEWDQQGNPIRIYGTNQDITKQIEMEEALRKSRENYKQLLQSTQKRSSYHKIIGKNKQMQRIYTLLEQLGDAETTVLITGETGTGKELIVNALHYSGNRSQGPLIKVNCSALSDSLLESEIFGHVRGAFTGAIQNKTGRIEAAEGGTLFLDEIGEISPRIQLKLLRFLEYKEFERVGDSQTLKANVRIVTATNVELAQKVEDGGFRQDLYYRLKVMPIQLPPLRERTEDIPLLVDHFCQHFSKVFKKDIKGVSQEVLEIFIRYPWPGNIRELENTIEHACLLCSGSKIEAKHLPLEIIENKASHDLIGFKATQSKIDKETILQALAQSKDNKKKAANILGISRRTLYRKMHKFGILE